MTRHANHWLNISLDAPFLLIKFIMNLSTVRCYSRLQNTTNISRKTTYEISNTEIPENVIDEKKKRSTWARLIKKVYGTDTLVCPECGSEMKIIAIIMDTEETTRILEHLVKIGRPPPNFDPAFLN